MDLGSFMAIELFCAVRLVDEKCWGGARQASVARQISNEWVQANAEQTS